MSASFTESEQIDRPGGQILKVTSASRPDFIEAKEVYCSTLEPFVVRAWKLHTEMTVNAFVPVGEVTFVVKADDRFETYKMGPSSNWGRLTIEPGTWFGFQGGPEGGIVLNMADTVHDPNESQTKPLDSFEYQFEAAT